MSFYLKFCIHFLSPVLVTHKNIFIVVSMQIFTDSVPEVWCSCNSDY